MSMQNFIELFTIPFQAGESKLFHISGQYFELVDAPDPVDVLLLSRNGEQRGIMRGAEASFHLKNTDFSQVQITSATAQTIRIGYGSGEAGTRRAAGTVSISSQPPVALDAATLAALELQRRPALPGGAWVSNATVVANTPLTVFTPASNVNGAILWQAGAVDVSGPAVAHQVFIAKASAPATIIDGEVLAQSMVSAINPSVNIVVGIDLRRPCRLAPGLGLYFISGFAGTSAMLRSARFTLL